MEDEEISRNKNRLIQNNVSRNFQFDRNKNIQRYQNHPIDFSLRH